VDTEHKFVREFRRSRSLGHRTFRDIDGGTNFHGQAQDNKTQSLRTAVTIDNLTLEDTHWLLGKRFDGAIDKVRMPKDAIKSA
jgi:hypothetical protein